MAVDESLLHLADTPVLRLYQWNVPAVSIGYFQPWTLVPKSRLFVRRYTGGGLVDHTSDCTYTVVAPRESQLGSLSTTISYELIHRAIAGTLKVLGLVVEIVPDSVTIDSSSCFQKPVKFDITLQGIKIAGAAQRRTRYAFLQQGSILLPDPSLYGPLRELLPSVLAQTIGLTSEESTLTKQELSKAEELERDRYSQLHWNQER